MFAPAYKPRRPTVDWPLVLAILGLMVVGAVFIASATLAKEGAGERPWYRLGHLRQLAWYLLGIGLSVLVCLNHYRRLARWSMLVYWVTIVLLVAVLIEPIGSERMGARRWIALGPLQFQPSEFAKLAFILAMASFLSRPESELRPPRMFFKALGMTVIPFILILREPDLGSALILFPVGLVMMFVAGIPARYLWQFVGGLSLIIVLLLVDILFAPPGWQLKLEPYQRKRLMVYFGTSFIPRDATEAERRKALKEYRDASYNVDQALISVGSGGVVGKGWRQGTQNSLGFLPPKVAHNDFIFSVIAEESGFLGSVIVLTLYTVVLFSGVRIAGQARDRLGKLLATGVVTLFFCHVFINIGMNIRLMPVTGIPLPLLSYGGTSVWCSLIAVGLLQNVHLYRRS